MTPPQSPNTIFPISLLLSTTFLDYAIQPIVTCKGSQFISSIGTSEAGWLRGIPCFSFFPGLISSHLEV